MATGGEATDYCRNLVETADEDFHLSLPYASVGDRARLTAIFAFHIELRRIPHAVSEPPLGEIRLQWWRDAITGISAGRSANAHPVIEALRMSGAADEAFRAVADGLIDARARLLYEPTFSSLGDLKEFLAAAEAPIATLAYGAGADVAVEKAGLAYALARFAPILSPALAADAGAAAADAFASCSRSLSRFSAAEAGRVAFLAFTPGYAVRWDGRRWPLGKRLALFRAMLTGRF